MYIEIDGLKIKYKESSKDLNKEAIIILQGWGTSMALYDCMKVELEEKYNVIQLDLPGFGESEEPKEAWDVEMYSDFVEKLIKKMKLNKLNLIGHSYGGRIIIKLASRENLPFEIKKIMLVSSAGILPKRNLKQKIKIFRYKIIKKLMKSKIVYYLFDDIVDEWINKQGSDDYRKASNIMKQTLVKAVNENLEQFLSKIRTETLLVWGENDDATPLADGILMERNIRNSALVKIKNAGHYCFLEKKEEFNKIMKSYFEMGDVK